MESAKKEAKAKKRTSVKSWGGTGIALLTQTMKQLKSEGRTDQGLRGKRKNRRVFDVYRGAVDMM